MDGKSALANGCGTGSGDANWWTLLRDEEWCNVVAYASCATRLRYRTLCCIVVSLYHCICIVRWTVDAFESTGNPMTGFGVFTLSHDSTTFHWPYMLSLSMNAVSLFYPVTGEWRAYRLFTIQRYYCIGVRFTFSTCEMDCIASKWMNSAEHTGDNGNRKTFMTLTLNGPPSCSFVWSSTKRHPIE